MTFIACTQCQTLYPELSTPHRCPECNGVYDFITMPEFNTSSIDQNLPGMWQYQNSFGLRPNSPIVTLGEGNTPLIWDTFDGSKIGFKLESLNPTGSFKDRGTALLLSHLLSRGVEEVVEDSSGNAGSSLAAYSARAGIRANIYVPSHASGPKRSQIEAYGAQLITVPGPRSAASEAVLKAARSGITYASHAFLPFGLPGLATIAYEIWQSLGTSPGTIITPAGHGNLMLGVFRGFTSLLKRGLISKMPYFIGAQPAACAPLVIGSTQGITAMNSVSEGETIAEGTRLPRPSQGTTLLKEITPDIGKFIAVEETKIISAHRDLARKGIYVEPTSALVWGALKKLIGTIPEPIILVLSGSGLKYTA
jgi:threonine synthase